jgi:hypothetical protein
MPKHGNEGPASSAALVSGANPVEQGDGYAYLSVLPGYPYALTKPGHRR